MVEGARLEIVCTARYRGFESLPLRQLSHNESLSILIRRTESVRNLSKTARNQAATGSRRGRPPFFPFAREAAAFRGDRAAPPRFPMSERSRFRRMACHFLTET